MQCKSLWIKASAKCIHVNVEACTGEEHSPQSHSDLHYSAWEVISVRLCMCDSSGHAVYGVCVWEWLLCARCVVCVCVRENNLVLWESVCFLTGRPRENKEQKNNWIQSITAPAVWHQHITHTHVQTDTHCLNYTHIIHCKLHVIPETPKKCLFSEGSTWMNVGKGVLEVLAGVLAGGLMGLLLHFLPSKDQVTRTHAHTHTHTHTHKERCTHTHRERERDT